MILHNVTNTLTIIINEAKQNKHIGVSHLSCGVNFIVNFTANTVHIVLLFGGESLLRKPV